MCCIVFLSSCGDDTQKDKNESTDSKNSDQVSEGDVGNEEAYYLLVGSNANQTTKIAIALTLKEREFQGDFSNSVICDGCSTGCDPVKVNRGFACSVGCSDNCKKTETLKSEKEPFKIGVEKNGDFEITMNHNQIKQKFDERLKESDLTPTLTDFSIISKNYE